VQILGIGRIQLLPRMAPIKLPGWIVHPLAKLVSTRLGAAEPSTPRLRLAIDLLRSVVAVSVAPSSATLVTLVDLGATLASRIQKEASPALLKWCVDVYRDEVNAITSGATKRANA
jgi:hypothetical protein